VLGAAGAGSVIASLALSQRGLPRRYLTFAYTLWSLGTLPFVGYALGTAVWHLATLAIVYGACMTGGMVVWGTLMQTRVPPELRGRVHSLDWFVSVALTPLSFALTGPVAKAIGADATLVVAGVVPCLLTAALFFVARLRRDEERVDAMGAPAT
jgi:MFS family permease